MASKIRLVICHHNRLFRESLSLALGVVDQMEIKFVDEPNAEAFEPLQECLELLLIDASLPRMLALSIRPDPKDDKSCSADDPPHFLLFAGIDRGQPAGGRGWVHHG